MKQKAVIVQEPGKIAIEERDIPKIKEDEALLRVKYCGICGSDVATYTGNQPFASYPRVPGHEFCALIEEIGPNDFGFKKGMAVTANPYFNCGKCYPCRKGNLNCCEDNKTMGVHIDGSFCEYIAMPISRLYNGKGLSLKELALIEPFSISYHAANRGNIQKGDNVLVIGAGAIGLFAMISAKLKGANVYVADVFEKRLELAKELGAIETINVSTQNLKEETNRITNGDGMDVCMEAVGLPQTFLDSIECAAFAGKVILIGNGKKETTFNHSIILKKELNIYGSRNSLNDFEPLIDIVGKQEIDILKIVSRTVSLEDTEQAFKALVNNDGSLFKLMIEF